MNAALYDRRRIPILPGDMLKIFHYVAGLKRERRYMYKLVLEILLEGPAPLLKISHSDLTEGCYFLAMNGRVMRDYEIVQGYAGVSSGQDFRDRERKEKI